MYPYLDRQADISGAKRFGCIFFNIVLWSLVDYVESAIPLMEVEKLRTA
jgi:hypothetical protein